MATFDVAIRYKNDSPRWKGLKNKGILCNQKARDLLSLYIV
jgi:hypothetical protein